MITIAIRDEACQDVEICQLTFSSQEKADQIMPTVFDDLLATYGSGSQFFYADIVDTPIH
jgi:hypothetical protein